jgi:single-strand DNA-binding protein
MHETYTTVVGNVATRVDLRSLPDGTPLASFRVATNERRRDRATGSWRDGDSLFVNVTCWRALGENVHASLGVGDPVIVRGRLFTSSWEKDGRRQSAVEMEGYAVGPDLARSTAEVRRTHRPERPEAGAEEVPPADLPAGESDDDGAVGVSWNDQVAQEQQAGAPHGGGFPPSSGDVGAGKRRPAEAGVGA